MRRVPVLRQAALLFRRSWLQNVRDKATNVSRAASNISSAFIFGSIFWRLGSSQISVQNRMGLTQVRTRGISYNHGLSFTAMAA